MVSRVGDDDLGRELREEVWRLGLSDEYIQTDPEHPTGTVRVTVDAAGQPSYTITEDVAWDYIAWVERLASLAVEAAAICFGSLAQRSPTSRRTIQGLLGTGTGIKVFDVNIRGEMSWDTHRLILDIVQRIDWLKMNVEELNQVVDGPACVMSWEPQERKTSALFPVFESGMDVRRVAILTRGGRSTVVSDWQRTDWVPAVPANVVDTVGAGDAFTAAMVCLHLEGRPLRDCARFANHYAARVCEHQGATPRINRAAVERAAFGPSEGTP
jgi:fructokinase